MSKKRSTPAPETVTVRIKTNLPSPFPFRPWTSSNCLLVWSSLVVFLFIFSTYGSVNLVSYTLMIFQQIGLLKRSCLRCVYRCGRFGVQFPGRANRTHCSQRLATVATFLRSCVAQALSRGVGPHHSLPRFGRPYYSECNETRIIKI